MFKTYIFILHTLTKNNYDIPETKVKVLPYVILAIII